LKIEEASDGHMALKVLESGCFYWCWLRYISASIRHLFFSADCFSGIWADHAQKVRNILEPGDVEEALNAASMIGDDRLQKQSRGYIAPDLFTHGTSAQRVTWFNRGFQTGSIDSCDTFKAQNLYSSLEKSRVYIQFDVKE